MLTRVLWGVRGRQLLPADSLGSKGGLGLPGVRGQHAEATRAQLPRLLLYGPVMLRAVLAATSYPKKKTI